MTGALRQPDEYGTYADVGKSAVRDGLERDADLLDGLASRSEVALREVVTTYGSLVFGTAIRLLKSEALAEEVAQDTFMALWLRPASVKASKGSLESYLRGIARYKAIDSIRREEARSYRETGAAANGVLEDFAIDLVDRLENRRMTREALSRLSYAHREIVVLTYLRGTGCREAADDLGIPLSTAKTRLRDALIKLRRTEGLA